MKHFILYTLLFVLAACSPELQTSFDYDKNADFSKYKTYNYAPQAFKIPADEQSRNQLISAIDHEMTLRGFSKSDNADVTIDLLLKTQEKDTPINTTNGVWGYGYGYGYGPGFSRPNIDVNEYVVGTLFIILADKKTDAMIWQGRGTKTLLQDPSAKKRERNIKSAIAAIFKNYPGKKQR
ncbi:MAG TPA: DUF4136 domain-containing protein [Ohtaekwangia sp.]